ncbi:signal recognition particle receptor beta [Leptinotarsa decemlineata]|uniref:signal recognition particle receptor beta n=1 Tax=Leptinotarsa decemlineata TaxID=7539 RepID=UPI003D305500
MAEKKVPVKLDGTDFTKIFISIFVIVITLVLLVLYKRRKSSRQGILLTGLCDSGKTLIFSQLIHNKHIQSHTSIKENIANYVNSFNKLLRIVDIPGHERLRDKFFDQYKDSTKGIVYVVDSLTLPHDIRDAAEYLYNILVDPVIQRNCPNLLILCNKQDQTFSKGASAIKSIFEKELNTLRITKSNQLESVDHKAKRIAMLGDPDEDFDFAALPLKVDIAESYAFHKNGSVDIEGLKKWLDRQI